MNPPGPDRRRVTMSDVASVAGVHKSTVSLALRNQPKLNAATRERIRKIAAELGYQPDPMLDLFNLYRRTLAPPNRWARSRLSATCRTRRRWLVQNGTR